MKWISPLAGLAVAALSAFEPNIQALISQHPSLAGVFAAIGIVASAYAPQPHK